MPNNLTAAQLSISDWVKNLAAIPAKDFSLENVQNFVIQHIAMLLARNGYKRSRVVKGKTKWYYHNTMRVSFSNKFSGSEDFVEPIHLRSLNPYHSGD